MSLINVSSENDLKSIYTFGLRNSKPFTSGNKILKLEF